MIDREKHYVIFYSPGTFVSEQTKKQIFSWDCKEAVNMSKSIVERHNAIPFSFKFQTFSEPELPKEYNEYKLEPKLKKESGLYHLGGTVTTYDHFLTESKDNIVISNMRVNEIWLVVVNNNSFRSTTPFEEDHFILGPDGEIVEAGNAPQWKKYRAKCSEEKHNESNKST